MRIFLGLLGILFGFVLVKYREQVGDMLGDPEWASKFGGIYNIVILIGIIFFFWSIAYMTGTEQLFLSPILSFFPQRAAEGGVPITDF